MKIILSLCFAIILVFAQESQSRMDCKSASGRTTLMVMTKNVKTFSVADFSIDDAYTSFNESFGKEDIRANFIVQRQLERGIFRLSYQDIHQKLFFHALPQSVKLLEETLTYERYTLKVLLAENTSDPRKLERKESDVALHKEITLECSLFISLASSEKSSHAPKGYKRVFNETITLGKEDKVLLSLYEEDAGEFIEKPAKVKIFASKSSKELLYEYTDDGYTPFLYFNKPKLIRKKSDIMDLSQGVHVFDIDDDGKNEIFIQGNYHQQVGDSLYRLLILEAPYGAFVLKSNILESPNFPLYYLAKENKVLFSVPLHRRGIETRYDKHKFRFYLYDIKTFSKIPLLISKEKFDTEDKVVEKNIDAIRAKLALYQKGRLSAKEEKTLIAFAKDYWERVGKEKAEKVAFTLSEFLLYKKGDSYVIEYKKESEIKSKEEYASFLSRMRLHKKGKDFIISSTEDIATLSLSEDSKAFF